MIHFLFNRKWRNKGKIATTIDEWKWESNRRGENEEIDNNVKEDKEIARGRRMKDTEGGGERGGGGSDEKWGREFMKVVKEEKSERWIEKDGRHWRKGRRRLRGEDESRKGKYRERRERERQEAEVKVAEETMEEERMNETVEEREGKDKM